MYSECQDRPPSLVIAIRWRWTGFAEWLKSVLSPTTQPSCGVRKLAAAAWLSPPMFPHGVMIAPEAVSRSQGAVPPVRPLLAPVQEGGAPAGQPGQFRLGLALPHPHIQVQPVPCRPWPPG